MRARPMGAPYTSIVLDELTLKPGDYPQDTFIN